MTTTAPSPVPLWLGTYPADGPEAPAGAGEGVWRLELDVATGALSGALAAATPAPSFVLPSADGTRLYAAGETSPGTVTCFTVTADGALTSTVTVGSGGGSPCHLTLHPDGRALYVANYGSGEVAVLTLGPDGDLSAEVLAAGGPVQALGHTGSGPRADRQEGPHAHSTTLAPGGRWLLVADLGTDELRRYLVADDGRLTADGVAASLPPGTGPRHLALLPGDHLAVVGELSGTLHLLAWDREAGTARSLQVLPVCASPVVTGTELYPAHVVALPDGGALLVSVRGPDVLARFAVHDGGARLEHVGDVPVGGAWPRHLAVHPDGWAVVAVQNGDAVTTLRWDGHPDDGVVGRLAVAVPSCVQLA